MSVVLTSLICFFICPVGGFIRQNAEPHLNPLYHAYLKSYEKCYLLLLL